MFTSRVLDSNVIINSRAIEKTTSSVNERFGSKNPGCDVREAHKSDQSCMLHNIAMHLLEINEHALEDIRMGEAELHVPDIFSMYVNVLAQDENKTHTCIIKSPLPATAGSKLLFSPHSDIIILLLAPRR